MKKILLLISIAISFNVGAFSLPKLDNLNLTDNVSTAIKVLHDGGIKCEKVTHVEPILGFNGKMKEVKVQCDNKTTYTLIKNSDGMAIKS